VRTNGSDRAGNNDFAKEPSFFIKIPPVVLLYYQGLTAWFRPSAGSGLEASPRRTSHRPLQTMGPSPSTSTSFDAASGGGGEQRLRRALSFDEVWIPSLPEKKSELGEAVERDVASGEGKLEEGDDEDDAVVVVDGRRVPREDMEEELHRLGPAGSWPPRSQPRLADTARAGSEGRLTTSASASSRARASASSARCCRGTPHPRASTKGRKVSDNFQVQ
jgi:hypothetical protein